MRESLCIPSSSPRRPRTRTREDNSSLSFAVNASPVLCACTSTRLARFGGAGCGVWMVLMAPPVPLLETWSSGWIGELDPESLTVKSAEFTFDLATNFTSVLRQLELHKR